MSYGLWMGWYDSSKVRGDQNFQVDSKAEIKVDYRGTPESTSMSLKFSYRLRKSYYESSMVKGGCLSSMRTKN